MHFSTSVNDRAWIRLWAHFAGANRVIIMHIIASNIFGSFVRNGRRDFLTDQAYQRRLAGIITNLLDSIPEDRHVATFGIAEISRINLQGGEWIQTRQL